MAVSIPSSPLSPDLAPAVDADDETELRIAHKVHSPGSFCSAGSFEGDWGLKD